MDDESPSPTVRTPIPEPPAPAPSPPPVAAPPPVTSTLPPVPPLPPAPAWVPPPPSRSSDRGRTASIIFGVIILAVGLWFFADLTLGLELPTIRWSQFWPLILIAIGGWIVLGTIRRDSR